MQEEQQAQAPGVHRADAQRLEPGSVPAAGCEKMVVVGRGGDGKSLLAALRAEVFGYLHRLMAPSMRGSITYVCALGFQSVPSMEQFRTRATKA